MALAFEQKVRDDFSRAARSYDDHAKVQRNVLSSLIEKASAYMQPDSLWLDAGCGTGAAAGLLNDHVRLVGIDVAWGMCQHADAQMPVAMASVERLPIKPAALDGVLSSLCIQWVEDVSSALSGGYNALKPGGVAAISTFGPNTLRELKTALHELDQPPRVNDFIDRQVIESGAVACGFELLEASEETYTTCYASMKEFFAELKAIGATYKASRAPLSRGQMRSIESVYAQRHPDFQASWHIYTLLLQKPA